MYKYSNSVPSKILLSLNDHLNVLVCEVNKINNDHCDWHIILLWIVSNDASVYIVLLLHLLIHILLHKYVLGLFFFVC